VQSPLRQKALIIVEYFWFDNAILFLIVLGSILQLCYHWQEPDDEGYNSVFNNLFEPVFTAFFTLELILKVIAWGFFVEKNSYLRDPWNWLDFVVVISALVGFILPGSSLSFLRVFKVLRPLRSLNKVPQMRYS
jgi:RsiW-degrading membrane proteinase PrsW (M82 family)